MATRRGDKGEMVYFLQHQLKKHNLDIQVDGHFGLETECAVRCVQSASNLNLTNDGIVGRNTEKALQQPTPLFDRPTKPVKTLLHVPYFSQRDNNYEPNGTCNVTSLAMTLAHHGVRPKDPANQLEDELFHRLQQPDARAYFEKNYSWAKDQGFNPRNVHGMLLWLAREYGFKAAFTWNATLKELDDHLNNHGPVILSGKFTGSGHIVTLVGFTHTWDLIINDPWGNWQRGYRREHDGNRVIYSLEDMASILRGKNINGKKAFMADLVYSF